ncbi:MAG TPA: hypothetical protein VOA80_16515 [Thermoanaerobaculia bacterium]|nr:hypothetical protein [Thermoanaerobaculia bacterium]
MSGDAPERLLPRRAVATLVGLAVALAGLGTPGQLLASTTISCDAPVLVATPLVTPQESFAQLGWAITVGKVANQIWLAAGANQDNGGAGSVSMFMNPGPGTPQWGSKLVSSDLQGGGFGTSVSIDGDWLAVGAPLADANGVPGSGAVYLFLRFQSSWVPNAKLVAADGVVGAHFGFSVSLKGNTLVVGAPGDSDRGSLSGSVYVFALQGTWQQTAKFHADDGRPFDEFGSAVAVAVPGNEIVVGAPFADDLQRFQNFGAAYVFHWTMNSGWALETGGKLTAGAFRPGNIQFGSAVAIGGDLIAVGAPGDDMNNFTDSGSAYVFDRNGAGWTPHPSLTADDPSQGAQFGHAVWLDGDSDRVLIGAPFGGSNAGGAAYLFARPEGIWQQQLEFLHTPGVGAFGQSVAILGKEVFLGGFKYNSGGVTQAGAVATCPLPIPMPMPHPFLTCTKMGPKSVDAGGLATYKITVANTGDAGAANVMLDDPPAGLAFVSAGQPCSKGFPCSLSSLPAHATRAPLEVTFRAPAGCPTQGSFTNVAKVTGDGANLFTCMALPTAIVRPPVLSCAELAPDTATPGAPVTYEVTVCNSGCEAAKDVILSDPTPPGLVLLGVGGGRCTQLPCNLGTIEPGQCLPSVEIRFELPDGCAPTSITNTAAVNASNAARPACPQVVTSVAGGADLGIVLSAPPQPFQVMGGESFKFSSVVSNAGPHTARDVTVTVSIGASAIVVSKPAGCSPVAGQPNQFTCLLGDLPCDGPVPLDFILQAPSCACCAAAGTSIDLAVDVHSRTPDPTPTLPTQASTTVQVTCPKSPCLSITKTETPDPAAPGQGVVYDITVSNAGPGAASGAVVEDHYPPELHDVLWCRGAACTPILSPPLADTIDLAAGETRTYRLSGIVHPMCSGVLHNLATVTPPSGVCNDPAKTQFNLDTQVVATGVYAFCEGFSGQLSPSTLITKTMLLINCGPANQADNPGDEFTDTLPAGLTLTGASATSGTASTSGNTVTWNGAIPAGGTVTITMTANIGAGTTGMVLCNQATVFYDADGDGINDSMRLSDDPDEPGPADPCCFQVQPPGIPALSLAGLAALALLLAGLAVWRLR